MKKNIFLFAILLCVSCGGSVSSQGGNTSPTTTSLTESSVTTTQVPTTTVPTTTVVPTTSASTAHIHTYSDKLTYDETHHWYETTCGHKDAVNKIKHTFKEVVTKPTYEEKGYTTYSCTGCDYSYKDNETEVLKHNYSSKLTYDETYHWYACTDKGYEHLKKGEEKHTFNSVVTNPTYEEKGYTTYSCSKCDYSYKDNETEMLKHNYSNKLTYDDESHWYACLDEGYENLKKDEKPHEFEKVVTPSTHTQKGYTTYSCKYCDYSYVSDITELLRYSITYNLDGGVNSKDNPSSFTIEEEIILKDPKKDGCAFAGWFDGNNNKVEVINKGTSHDVVLTAKWVNLLVIENNVVTGFDNTVFTPEVSIPDGVTTIEKGVFSGGELYIIVIPSSVTTIKAGAFDECFNLTYVLYEGTLEQWCNIKFEDSTSSPMFYAEGFYMLNADDEWYEVKDVIIPNGVTTIGNYQFFDFDNIESVIVPNSVTSINYFSFRSCVSMESITFESGSKLTTIGEDSFSDCTSLKAIEIPNSVTSIGASAFEECELLTRVNLTSNVKTIGESAFRKCTSLSDVTLPSTLTSISGHLFDECTSLETINIPSSVKTIGTFAFSNCSSLRSINIPSSVTSIESYAFYDCGDLLSIKIPSSVTTIGNQAFQYCYKLIIYCQASSKPSNWGTSFNPSYCPVYYGKSSSNILEQDGVQYIVSSGKALVSGCLETHPNMKIPSTVNINGTNYSVTSVGENAFADRENIDTVILPNTMKTLVDYSFNGSSLKAIVIPSSVTSIGHMALNCYYATLYCEASSKPSSWDSFWNYDDRPVYWAGEWEYNQDGLPTPKN